MEAAIVNSAGEVTIPQTVRTRMGIRQGSRVAFHLVGDHVEMRVVQPTETAPASGFGMLKSIRTAVPADLDPATLIGPP